MLRGQAVNINFKDFDLARLGLEHHRLQFLYRQLPLLEIV
jgi:hypothetical protein